MAAVKRETRVVRVDSAKNTVNIIVHAGGEHPISFSFNAPTLSGTIPVSRLNATYLREKLAPLLQQVLGRVT